MSAEKSQTVTLTIDEIEALIEKRAKDIASASPSQFASLAESLQNIATATQNQATEIARTVRKDNAAPPQISAFSHPEGNVAHPKAVLIFETYYLGMRLRGDELTPAEVDLFNRFTTSKTARHGTWTATVQQNPNGTSRLDIMVPSRTNDDRMNLPSLTLILRELLDGPDVADPNKTLTRLDAAEAEIKRLQAQLASKAA